MIGENAGVKQYENEAGTTASQWVKELGQA
jgi:hypothetical protein